MAHRIFQESIQSVLFQYQKNLEILISHYFFLVHLKGGITFSSSEDFIKVLSLFKLVSSFFALITHTIERFFVDGVKD